jgi:Zn-finger nucleic acid-binding protein
MQAETLNCPMCGAAAANDATHCLYCGARLATIACPQCFAMMFKGSRHCPRCGTSASRAKVDEASERARNCPRCRVALERIVLGATHLRECKACDGLWVDVESFEQICVKREEQSAVLGAAHFASAQKSVKTETGVRYVPCPECGQLMNRVNFARCSGVVVDVCKGHGTWFDRDELAGIIEFIRAGGLDHSRAREKAQLEETRRQLQEEERALARARSAHTMIDDDERHFGLGFAAGELLKLLKSG